VLSKPPIRAATFVHVKAGEEDDAVTEAPSRNRAVILGLVCAAQFMVVLDIATVNVALPSVQRDLGFGQSTLQWVVIAYGLILGGFLLSGGRMTDLHEAGEVGLDGAEG
jgi:MFS family permease